MSFRQASKTRPAVFGLAGSFHPTWIHIPNSVTRQRICWKTNPKGVCCLRITGTAHKGRLPGPNCSTNCWAFRSSTSKPPKSPPQLTSPGRIKPGEGPHSTRNSLDSSHHSWCKMLRYIQVWYNDNILMTYDWHICVCGTTFIILYHMSYVANMKLCQSTITWCLPRQPPPTCARQAFYPSRICLKRNLKDLKSRSL